MKKNTLTPIGRIIRMARIWEHVSVSLKKRLPTWEELKFIKLLFWDAEDEVIQFFPPQSEYVNLHENCLHLWRPRCELPWRKS